MALVTVLAPVLATNLPKRLLPEVVLLMPLLAMIIQHFPGQKDAIEVEAENK